MAEFENDTPEDRLVHEAEELMRQRRFQDAAMRYQDLRRFSPSDLWANLGYVSALECAGKINEAEQILEETTLSFRRSAPLHRFRHLFFERREDMKRAAHSQAALEADATEDGPEDQLADLYFNQGRYHEARAELQRLMQDGLPDDDEMKASVLARMGACQRQTGEHDLARDKLIEALNLDSGNHWILSELAEVERALGNIEAARRRYREALAAAPDDHWCRGHLAQMECEDGNLDVAVKLYRHILAEMPKAAWAKVELAQVLTEKDPAEAVKLCQSALDDDPTYPWAHAHLGNIARRNGKLEQAREHFRQALSSSPNSTWILHELADVCRHLGRMQEAYAHLEHARGFDAYDATTYGYFADLLRHEGKNASAMQHLEKAVELDDAYVWAWRELAELRALDARHESAEEAYRKAVELEPDEAINDGLKAFLLRCAGRREASIPYLERAVERQPDYLWAWREQIEFHLGRQSVAEAEIVARKALSAIPDSAPLMGMLAEALRRQGRRAEANEQIIKALGIDKDVPQLWAMRTELAMEEDEPGEALTFARKTATLDTNPEFKALLAQVLIANNQIDEAGDIARKLMAEPKPILAAYELSSLLAERARDLSAAKQWCDKGLAGPFPNEVRLLMRRARLGVQTQEANATAALMPLFDGGMPLPWREFSQLLAQNGQATMARRAAFQYLSSSACSNDDKAKGWLNLAELELILGNTKESGAALEHVLKIDPDCVPGQILGAVLADQRGDLTTAIGHLEHIDLQLHQDASDDDQPSRAAESALLLRQLSSLYERNNQLDKAADCWRRIMDKDGDSPSYRAEYAAYLLRQNETEKAEGIAQAILPGLTAEFQEGQRLLRDLAIAEAQNKGARAGLNRLLTHQAALSIQNRMLLAQIALSAGDPALAKSQVTLAGETDRNNRAVHILLARTLIAGNEIEDAEKLARALCEQAPADEESATLLAETLAMQQRFPEALAALSHQALPARPNLERGLLTAVVHLEANGSEHCLTALGKIDNAHHGAPLVRLFAAAWPNNWTKADAANPARREDVRSLPPFPRLANRLAQALARHGRLDLASTVLVNIANAHDRHRPQVARQLRQRAVSMLCRLGERGNAWKQAWMSRSVTALLRCLWP